MGSEEEVVLLHHVGVEVEDLVVLVSELHAFEVPVVGLLGILASLGANLDMGLLPRSISSITIVSIVTRSKSIWFWRVDFLGVDLSFWLSWCDFVVQSLVIGLILLLLFNEALLVLEDELPELLGGLERVPQGVDEGLVGFVLDAVEVGGLHCRPLRLDVAKEWQYLPVDFH